VGPRNYIRWDPDPHGKGYIGPTFEGMTSGFSRMATSVSIVRPQKQSRVTLYFPNEKFPCDAASRQISLTICYCYYCYEVILKVQTETEKIYVGIQNDKERNT